MCIKQIILMFLMSSVLLGLHFEMLVPQGSCGWHQRLQLEVNGRPESLIQTRGAKQETMLLFQHRQFDQTWTEPTPHKPRGGH